MPKAACVVAAVLLAACAGTYQPPEANQPRARMRVVNESHAGNNILQVFELPDRCTPRHLDPSRGARYNVIGKIVGASNLSPSRRAQLGMPHAPAEARSFTEFHVPAGKPFYFATYFETNFSIRQFNTCYVGLSFVPEAGRDYELVFSANAAGCQQTLSTLTGAGAPAPRPVAAERIVQQCP